jgi:hypothetical protein
MFCNVDRYTNISNIYGTVVKLYKKSEQFYAKKVLLNQPQVERKKWSGTKRLFLSNSHLYHKIIAVFVKNDFLWQKSFFSKNTFMW